MFALSLRERLTSEVSNRGPNSNNNSGNRRGNSNRSPEAKPSEVTSNIAATHTHMNTLRRGPNKAHKRRPQSGITPCVHVRS